MPKVYPSPTTVPTGKAPRPPVATLTPLPIAVQIKQKTWQNARQVIKDEFVADPNPGGMRHAFLANIAMLLYDQYGMDGPIANAAADDIIKLAFEDTYY